MTTWREVSDTAELDKRPALPVAVLVACWYDGQFRSSFVTEADYFGDGYFGARGGGTLGACVVTHWQHKPPPPPEQEMLRIALSGVLPSTR